MFNSTHTNHQKGAPRVSGLSAFMLWGSQHPLAFKGFAVFVGLLMSGLLAYFAPSVFDMVDERSDSLTWSFSKTSPERRVVVVDIDEKSVQALGAWPWSRETMAKLVSSLNDYGVGLKLFDIVMPEGKDGDAALRLALKSGAPSIGGQIFSIDPNVLVKSGSLSGAFGGSGPCAASTPMAYGFIGNERAIAQSFALTGHLTPVIDSDGAVRKVPAWVCFEGQSYPALSVAAMMQLGQFESGPQTHLLSSFPWWVKGKGLGEAPWTLRFKNLPDFSLPLNEKGQIRVSYRTPRNQFVSLSAVDVIEHRAPKEMLSGVWALVGSTAFGAGDAIPTPHGGAEGGLEVHAQLIAAALDDATPFTPIGSSALEFGLVALGVIMLLSLSVFARPITTTQGAALPSTWHQREWAVFTLPLLGVFWVLACYGVHAWGLLSLNYWWHWSWSASALALSALMLASADLAQLRWQRTRLFENLSSYLSGSAAQDVALSESTDVVTGRQLPVTVMSINLRNFDRFCASQEAALSARLLHDYLSLLNEVVKKAGGELEHVQGAEVLAVWRESPNLTKGSEHSGVDPDSLLSVTQTLWRHSQAWLKSWSEEHKLEVAPSSLDDFSDLMGSTEDPIRLGAELELEIGLEQGVALIGSVGPKERRVYTVLGEPVQVAQSLRSMCSELAYPVLLGPVFGAHFGVQPSKEWIPQDSIGTQKTANFKSVSLQSSGSQNGSKLTQVVHMTPVRLGEFLLPGTLQAKLVFAMPVEFNVNRLHLIDTISLNQQVA